MKIYKLIFLFFALILGLASSAHGSVVNSGPYFFVENKGQIIDQNGIVNSFDLAFVRNSIVAPSEANLEKCDVNWDGVCNGVDYGLMGAAISVKTEDE